MVGRHTRTPDSRSAGSYITTKGVIRSSVRPRLAGTLEFGRAPVKIEDVWSLLSTGARPKCDRGDREQAAEPPRRRTNPCLPRDAVVTTIGGKSCKGFS